MSYNLRGLRDDVDALANIVRDSGADVLIAQESPRFWRWRSRCADLAARCHMVVLGGGAPACGNMLFSRLAIALSRLRIVRLPLTPGEQVRAAVIAECLVAGQQITVVGVHLGHTAPERLRHVEVLLDELEMLTTPVVLGGDLNENASGPIWTKLGERLTDAAKGDERLTFSCAKPRGRIDALFVDPRLRVARYDVVDSALARRASDHFPILAELELHKQD